MTTTTVTLATLAERLQWARLQRGLNCAELDEISDLSCGHSAKIESGARGAPSAATVAKLATALKIEVGWLINGGKRPVMRKRKAA